jgi:HTH-type transcriptional regulator / antitoxin HigA
MATDPRSAWTPDWSVAPGDLLVEALEERGMTQAELARRIGRPLKTISEIANGKASITPDTAIQLERALGISASFWNGLETRYREAVAYERARRSLEAEVGWLSNFPMNELVSRGLIPAGLQASDRLGSLLSFFGVANPAAWQVNWDRSAGSYRLAKAYKSDEYALAAWLRWGEKEAERVRAGVFDAARFEAVLREARGLSRLTVLAMATERLRDLAAEAGVVVLVIPELPGARVSGAARWLRNDRALIQLSLRYLSDDQFWFSLFHEAGHLLRGKGKVDYIEDLDSTDDNGDEETADSYARNLLLPPGSYELFVAARDFSANAVQAYAEIEGLSAGIVVGRLQRDQFVPSSRLNHLKRRYSAP